MAAQTPRLIGEKRSGSKNNNLTRTYKQVWRVETTDPLDGPAVVLAASGLPTRYVTTYASGNDSDPQAICISVEASEEGNSRKSWIVTADYSTRIPAQLQPQENPLDDPILESLSFDQYSTVARRGRRAHFESGDLFNGSDVETPIWNSLAQTFRPPVEVDDSRATYVCKRNEAYVNVDLAAAMVNSVNESAWKGRPPRTVKCQSITTSETQQRNDFTFYIVTYTFQLNPDTWDLFILNQGTKFVSSGRRVSFPPGSDPKTIYTGEGDGVFGEVVPESETEPELIDIYMRFRYYREQDFSIFNL